jgi:hypothetical protein
MGVADHTGQVPLEVVVRTLLFLASYLHYLLYLSSTNLPWVLLAELALTHLYQIILSNTEIDIHNQ